MPEQQNTEYKTSWHDDYLKWVCGFANANGGILCIGKDDHGKVVGVANYKKLMEDLPNKIRDILGITAEVNLFNKNKDHYIEIVITPYTVPISFREKYYYRSGSTTRELTGNALNEFLLKKSGKSWDEVHEAQAKLSDIDKKSVDQFLKSARKAQRFPADERLSLKALLEKLLLLDKGKLRRAAIVMFGKDPRRFYQSLVVRIGRFGDSVVDLRFQESVEGNLVFCLEEVLNQLDRKFLVRPISFEGIHRIEKDQYPQAALREVLLNALVHRNYMGSHVQIKVFDDRISFWNDGALPDDLTIELLKKTHSSKPRNPFIAGACFKGGYIDTWGRGIEKIINACKEEGLPAPLFEENSGGLLVTLFVRKYEHKATAVEKTVEIAVEKSEEKIMAIIKSNPRVTQKELMTKTGLTRRGVEWNLSKLKAERRIQRVGPDKGGHWEIL